MKKSTNRKRLAKPPDSDDFYQAAEQFTGKRIKIVHFTLSRYVGKWWVQRLEQACKRLSKIRCIATRFIHYYYCSVLQEKRKIPPLENFVRSMFTCFTSQSSQNCKTGSQEKEKLIRSFCVSEEKEKDQSILRAFLEEVEWTRIPVEGFGNILTHAANQYTTNLKLHHKIALKAHYEWYLKATYNVTKKSARVFIEKYWPDLGEEEEKEEEEARKEIELEEEEEDEEDEEDFDELGCHVAASVETKSKRKKELEELEAKELNTLQDRFIQPLKLATKRQPSKTKEQKEEEKKLSKEEKKQFKKEQREKKSISYHICVQFHYDLLQKVEEINRQRTAQDPPVQPVRTWSLCPIVNQTRSMIRVDEQGLQSLYSVFPLLDPSSSSSEEPEYPVELTDVFSRTPKSSNSKDWQIGDSFLTDGVQLQIVFEKKVTMTKVYTSEKEWNDSQQKKKEKQKLIQDYERQRNKKAKREENEEKEEEAEEKIDGRCTRTRIPVCDPPKLFRPAGASFLAYKSGIFQASSLQQHPEERKHFKRVIAIDPGRSNIFSCGLLKCPDEDQFLSRWEFLKDVKSGAYYTSIGQRAIQQFFSNKKQTNLDQRWKIYQQSNARYSSHKKYTPKSYELAQQQTQMALNIKEIELSLSTRSIRTSNLHAIKDHFLHYYKYQSDLVEFYGTKHIARLSFDRFQQKEEFKEQLLKDLAPVEQRDQTILLLGNARFATSSKGTSPSPVRALVDFLARHVRIALVDEFNTTKMCRNCTNPSAYKRHEDAMDLLSREQPKLPDSFLHPYFKKAKTFDPEELPFQPMICFKRDLIPQARLKKLNRMYPDPQRLEQKKQEILSREIHGLRRCSCCLRIYNRDHIAYQNIGDKGLCIWSGQDVPAPFNRSKYSQVAHSLEQKLESEDSSSSSSSSSSSLSRKPTIKKRVKKRKEPEVTESKKENETRLNGRQKL